MSSNSILFSLRTKQGMLGEREILVATHLPSGIEMTLAHIHRDGVLVFQLTSAAGVMEIYAEYDADLHRWDVRIPEETAAPVFKGSISSLMPILVEIFRRWPYENPEDLKAQFPTEFAVRNEARVRLISYLQRRVIQ